MKCGKWPPPPRKKRISLAVASSLLSTEPTRELKAVKASLIARAAGIFRADEIIIYRDKGSRRRDQEELFTLLSYLATPPYLRRRLIPLKPELRIAGLLLPLNIPTHDLPPRPRRGLVMYGIVDGCEDHNCQVYLGRYGTGILRAERRVPQGSLLLVRIVGLDPIVLEEAREPGVYTGFRVVRGSSLGEVASSYKAKGYAVIGTSRRGECLNSLVLEEPGRGKRGMLVVVGGPRGSVVDDAGGYEYFDAVVNLVPFQGTRTIRSEEAVLIALSLLAPLDEAPETL
ncbi:MAG: RNA methyltransferase [Desulfurococcales archaeon]|nr:RNA methyltransferase [Desulfurococcales archaeon]